MIDFFRKLLGVFGLDLFDLNYLSSTESCEILSCNPSILPKKGYLVRAGAYAVHCIQEIPKSFIFRTLPGRSVLFFATTKNQKDSLSYVAELSDGAVIAGEKCCPQYPFPLFWAYLIAPIFLPCLIFKYLTAGAYQKKTFRYFSDIYLLTYGYYVAALFWLRWSKPRALVLANDHLMNTRVLARIAMGMHIPTIYLQHASVTEKFPPLIFNYALLEGADALKKYALKGPINAETYLIGMPKADFFSKSVNDSSSVKRIGISCGMFDDVAAVEELCKSLKARFPSLSVVLRPHPGDRRRLNLWTKIASNLEFVFSDPESQKAFDFLSSVDSIIAGESNIHLEAALLNVYPLYYTYGKEMVDWYGFNKNGVVESFSNFDALLAKIQAISTNKPSVRQRCKPYCHTVETPFDWRSGFLAKSLIERIAYGESTDEVQWSGCTEYKNSAFQPQ